MNDTYFSVPASMLHHVWPRVSDGLNISLEKSNAIITISDVYDSIARGHWQLWVALEENEPSGNIVGSAVTEVVEGTSKIMILHLGYCDPKAAKSESGVDYLMGMYEYLMSMAKIFGCTVFQVESGRKGYFRRIQHMGFEQHSVIYRKKLNETPSS